MHLADLYFCWGSAFMSTCQRCNSSHRAYCSISKHLYTCILIISSSSHCLYNIWYLRSFLRKILFGSSQSITIRLHLHTHFRSLSLGPGIEDAPSLAYPRQSLLTAFFLGLIQIIYLPRRHETTTKLVRAWSRAVFEARLFTWTTINDIPLVRTCHCTTHTVVFVPAEVLFTAIF